MDDSNDITDTAQVVVFARAIKDNFDRQEKYGKSVSICTDGAPVMMGNKSGCLALLEQFLCLPILEVYKPAPVHYCTDFTSTATVSTYGRDIRRIGSLLQAVRVVLDSHPHSLTSILSPLGVRYQIDIRSLGSIG
ncbi:hypothetical protein RF11_05510 [Thelohanellus kitauei]|uniref:DUF4371 domain-containing protein n=1 Tax=Thelohanellus kitauei TaxID=669202 RepID=A0A0C2MK06_THEKT|nr:hypothetical protein RF11_05510 [Thelohanellus kitauei]